MPAVTASNVEFRYGSTIAIARSSFTIPREAITTLIGPNGSGKSTILNAIAGLATPTSGTLTVEGASSRNRIAFVLQTTKVNDALPITVREVVSMGRYPSIGEFSRLNDSDKAIVDAAMERMSIIDPPAFGRMRMTMSSTKRKMLEVWVASSVSGASR